MGSNETLVNKLAYSSLSSSTQMASAAQLLLHHPRPPPPLSISPFSHLVKPFSSLQLHPPHIPRLFCATPASPSPLPLEVPSQFDREGTPPAPDLTLPERKVPELTVKEKKELGCYAHSLGDKLKCQQVGKSGVTANVVMAMNETLEANELLKLKIHKTCPGELDNVVSLLEQATGSVVVGQIGRTVIFYRPSLTKLKAEEKKKLTRRSFAGTDKSALPSVMVHKRGNFLGESRAGHGRRGSSRFEKLQDTGNLKHQEWIQT